MDGQVPEEDFFTNAGMDLFPTFFKLTFYHRENSIVNNYQPEVGYLGAITILPQV